jgi:hypothetical protein
VIPQDAVPTYLMPVHPFINSPADRISGITKITQAMAHQPDAVTFNVSLTEGINLYT